MSKEEIEKGKQWVVKRLIEVANKSNILLKSKDCKWNYEPVQSNNYLLVVEYGEKRCKEKFIEENLEDCIGDKDIKAKLGKQIDRIVKSLK